MYIPFVDDVFWLDEFLCALFLLGFNLLQYLLKGAVGDVGLSVGMMNWLIHTHAFHLLVCSMWYWVSLGG